MTAKDDCLASNGESACQLPCQKLIFTVIKIVIADSLGLNRTSSSTLEQKATLSFYSFYMLKQQAPVLSHKIIPQ
jgi:hypothetical protein